MPDYHRAYVPGGSYFFHRQHLQYQMFLTDVDVRAVLREAIVTIRLSHPFSIEAWVLLPDHVHALCTLPPGDRDFSYRWRIIKRSSRNGVVRDSTGLNGWMRAARSGTRARCGNIGFGSIASVIKRL